MINVYSFTCIIYNCLFSWYYRNYKVLPNTERRRDRPRTWRHLSRRWCCLGLISVTCAHYSDNLNPGTHFTDIPGCVQLTLLFVSSTHPTSTQYMCVMSHRALRCVLLIKSLPHWLRCQTIHPWDRPGYKFIHAAPHSSFFPSQVCKTNAGSHSLPALF